MKKTVLSIIMVFALVFSFMPSMAADSVSVDMDMFQAMFANLGNNLNALTAEERVEVFTIGKEYLTTSLGIETVKKVLNGDITNEKIQKLLEVVGGNSDYKNELTMFLDFADAFDESVRTQYINDIQARKAYELPSAAQTSMQNVYDRFVSAEVQEMLLSSHRITGNVILNPFDALKDRILLTDDSTNKNKLALKSIDSSFQAKLNEKWAGIETINGKTVTDAEDIITAFIDAFNNSSKDRQLQDIKNVFGEMKIYTPLEQPSTPTPTPKPTRRPSGGTTVYVPSTTDIPNTDVPIGELPDVAHQAYIRGYSDGTVRPNDYITREEMAVIVYRVKSDEDADTFPVTGEVFSDVARERWSVREIEYMADKKVLQGYPTGEFGPEGNLTRAELAAIIARVGNFTETDGANSFTDLNDSHWAYQSVLSLCKAGIVSGYEDGTFKADNNVTRAEVMAIVNRFLGRKPLASYVKTLDCNLFSDLQADQWFYTDVLEATVSHDFEADENGFEAKWKNY